MALIKCPECGHEVADTAHQCPNCGKLFNKQIAQTGTSIMKLMIGLSTGLVLCMSSFGFFTLSYISSIFIFIGILMLAFGAYLISYGIKKKKELTNK